MVHADVDDKYKRRKSSKMTKKEMRKIFKEAYIDMEMFPIDIYFVDDKNKFKAMCDWIKADAVLEVGGRTIMHENEDGHVMIYIGVFNGLDSTLVHECVHAALFLAQAIGHKLGEVDELVPYATGYLFDKCKAKMV